MPTDSKWTITLSLCAPNGCNASIFRDINSNSTANRHLHRLPCRNIALMYLKFSNCLMLGPVANFMYYIYKAYDSTNNSMIFMS